MAKVLSFSAGAPCLRSTPEPTYEEFDVFAELHYVGFPGAKQIKSVRVHACNGFFLYERRFSGGVAFLTWLRTLDPGDDSLAREVCHAVMQGRAVTLPFLFFEEDLKEHRFALAYP